MNAQLYAGLTFLLNPPMFEAIQATTTTSIPSGTSWTPINFSDAAGILADTYGGWSSSNPTRYTAQTPGWYWASGAVCFATNVTGNRAARIAKNGNPVQGAGTLIGGPAGSSQATAIATPLRKVYLNGTTDYLEVHGLQTSGGSLNTQIYGDVCSALSISFAHL
ncbi:hypothetical protein E6W39_24165 [Kitasatospora acidiphila]|uniref:Uncharacterized protein n=1 Tax=Kitasatospora acidiphila TaxID=2567942 RepID=A0A540W6W5_9ACTN|nr:hypothetical protein [Kitasatospora acidiphila]TQF04752.1 hypothetical protein E6W39_24165 [Kitasatospora acidiphila]